MEVGDGEWVVGPLVAVELLEESIVSLGEGPNNAVGSLHSAHTTLLTSTSHDGQRRASLFETHSELPLTTYLSRLFNK